MDFLIPSVSYGTVGVQRKSILDFVASVEDGRLAKEVRQTDGLGLRVLLLEGKVTWTDSGLLIANGLWTRTRHLATVWSMSSRGWWTMSSLDVEDSVLWLRSFESWLKRPVEEHQTLQTRPGAGKNEWGMRDSKEWCLWLLQGFEGIGRKTALAIYDHFNGIPMAWTVGVEELMEVKGIGRNRAQRMIEALNGK